MSGLTSSMRMSSIVEVLLSRYPTSKVVALAAVIGLLERSRILSEGWLKMNAEIESTPTLLIAFAEMH